jgi:hypothetical protein
MSNEITLSSYYNRSISETLPYRQYMTDIAKITRENSDRAIAAIVEQTYRCYDVTDRSVTKRTILGGSSILDIIRGKK